MTAKPTTDLFVVVAELIQHSVVCYIKLALIFALCNGAVMCVSAAEERKESIVYHLCKGSFRLHDHKACYRAAAL